MQYQYMCVLLLLLSFGNKRSLFTLFSITIEPSGYELNMLRTVLVGCNLEFGVDVGVDAGELLFEFTPLSGPSFLRIQ